MFLALPYYSHSSAKGIYSCFLYTTQGDAEHAELQESDIQMILRGCYIAAMRLHRKKTVFISQSLFVYFWHMEHICDYLFQWKAQDSPLHQHFMPLCDELAIVFVPRALLFL